jgi:hypothetical protein
MTLQLRRLPDDGDFVTRRLGLLESWAASGKIEPWLAVLIAEWVRTKGGRTGGAPSLGELQSLMLDEALVDIMRDQAEGPWAVYTDQAFGQRANDSVMTSLMALETAFASADKT